MEGFEGLRSYDDYYYYNYCYFFYYYYQYNNYYYYYYYDYCYYYYYSDYYDYYDYYEYNYYFSCGVVWRDKVGTLLQWGFSRCTDSARLRQDSAAKTSKLAQNCGKTEVLHLQPFRESARVMKIELSANLNTGFIRF